MATGLTDYAENKVLNFILVNTTDQTPPGSAGRYLSLHTTDPGDAASATEVSGGGYVRKTITFNTASGTSGSTTNSNAPTWTASGGSWTVTYIGIWDASSAGNLLAYGPLTQSRTVADGDTLTFNASSITVTIS
jgi:hypothetical protein